MTREEYLRVRRYQMVMTAWEQLNVFLNVAPSEDTCDEIGTAHRKLREWLAREQERFDREVQGEQ